MDGPGDSAEVQQEPDNEENLDNGRLQEIDGSGKEENPTPLTEHTLTNQDILQLGPTRPTPLQTPSKQTIRIIDPHLVDANQIVDPATLSIQDGPSGQADSTTKLANTPSGNRHVSAARNISHTLSPVSDTPKSDSSESWPVSLKGGGSAGKTGRVIERLNREKDKLTRDLNDKAARLEEAEKQQEICKLLLEGAQESAATSRSMYETSQAMLTRKERKVEELRLALESEKLRRESAEKDRREMTDLLQQTQTTSRREVDREREIADHAKAQYEALRGGLKSRDQSYSVQIAKLRSEFLKLEDQTNNNHVHLQRLEGLGDEIRMKQGSVLEVNERIVTNFQNYKKESDTMLRDVAWMARENEAKGDELLKEMEETIHKMKWAMAVKRDVMDA